MHFAKQPGSLHAIPGQAAAEERHADEAAHVELFASVLELEPDGVDPAVAGIEDLAAAILVALFLEPPQKIEADERLILPLARAVDAARVIGFAGGGENLFDKAAVLAVDPIDADDPRGAAGSVGRQPVARGRSKVEGEGRQGNGG